MSPKKKAAKTIQKPIITIELGVGCPKSNAPGRKSTANIATTSAGDPSRIAIVRRLRTNVSSVRWVSTAHCVNRVAATRVPSSRGPVSSGGAPTARGATCAAVPSTASRSR